MSDVLLDDFLRHRHPSLHVQRVLDAAVAETARGSCPVAVDAMRYQLLGGTGEDELRRSAGAWFRDFRVRRRVVIDDLKDRLSRTTGATVLLSEAPTPCLQFIADDVGATYALGADLDIDDYGSLTGFNNRPMVRIRRLGFIGALLAARAISPLECVAHVLSPFDDDLAGYAGSRVDRVPASVESSRVVYGGPRRFGGVA